MNTQTLSHHSYRMQTNPIPIPSPTRTATRKRTHCRRLRRGIGRRNRSSPMRRRMVTRSERHTLVADCA
jgi:hypothetical protein